MTAHDFVKNYIMHDSLIDSIEVLDAGRTLVLMIDFAFWMQVGYNENDPETGLLQVTFSDVSDYSIPKDADWNEISILEATASGNTVKFSLMNDMTDAYLELIICSEQIVAEKLSHT